ncbi:MAG: hypothetical protein HKN62_16370 [Phycisphaerales bacterium]|nr:hypothetical protein [Phycisphaerales bacterium]
MLDAWPLDHRLAFQREASMPEGCQTSRCAIESLHCSNCGYDLRGSPRDAVCPECAQPVRVSRLAGRAEWSPAIALRRAVLHTLVYSVASAIALFGLLWLAKPLLNWFAAAVAPRGFAILALVGAAIGFVLTCVLWHQLCDRAGFVGGILVPLAAVGVAGAAALAAWSAIVLAGVAVGAAVTIAGSATFIAYVLIVTSVMTD